MNTTSSRALAAALAAAASLLIPVQTAVADPNAGTAVVSTGDDDYFVSAESVTIYEQPSVGTSTVEVAHQGDVLTAHRTVDTGRHSPAWWIEATDPRTGAHGYVPIDVLADDGRAPAAMEGAAHPDPEALVHDSIAERRS